MLFLAGWCFVFIRGTLCHKPGSTTDLTISNRALEQPLL